MLLRSPLQPVLRPSLRGITDLALGNSDPLPTLDLFFANMLTATGQDGRAAGWWNLFKGGSVLPDEFIDASTGALTYGAHNGASWSEDFTNAAWPKSNATVTPGVSDPLGGSTAFTLTATIGNGSILRQGIAGTANLPIQVSTGIWIRRRTGSGSINYVTADGALWGSPIPVTSDWTLFSDTKYSTGAPAGGLGVRIVAAEDAVDIWHPQFNFGPLQAYIPTTAPIYSLTPRITYSRGSLATMIGPDGLVRYAPHNLQTYSNDFTHPSWTKHSNVTVAPNTVAAPDGTITASTINVASAALGLGIYFYGTPTFNGLVNTKSVWLMADTAGGTLDLVDSGTQGAVTTAVLSTTWQRFSVTETPSSPQTLGGLWVRKTASSPGTFYMCWAQQNLGPLQPYYPTGATAYHGPRFTHDPVTLQPLGLLVEEQRTNLISQSEFAASWPTYLGAVLTPANATGPNGVANAAATLAFAAAAASRTEQVITTGSGAHTFSVWIRTTSGTGNRTVTIRAGATVGTPVSVTEQWQRFSVTETLVGGSNYPMVSNETGVAFNVQVWGAQLEASAFPTSYIPTTSASVVRQADSAQMTGTNFSSWWNATEGTFAAQWRTAQFAGSITPEYSFAVSSTGGDAEAIGTPRFTPDVIVAYVRRGNTDQVALNFPVFNSASATIKSAITYALNDVRASVNGSAAQQDTSVIVPVPVRLEIGQRADQFRNNAPVERIRYFNRALPDATLQRFSAAQVQLPLDVISAAAAYSLRKLRTLYTGDACLVRNQFNIEQPIPFSPILDATGNYFVSTSALLAHCGAGSGWVTAWYDQMSSGRHATQSVAANQPRIVNAGVVDTLNGRPTLWFDGVNDVLTNASAIIAGNTSYMFTVVYSSSQSATVVPFFTGVTAAGSGTGIGYNVASNVYNAFIWSSAESTSTPLAANTPIIHTSRREAGVSLVSFVNGVAGSVAETPSANFGANISIGAATNQFYLTGPISEVVGFNSALSTTDRQALERNQGAVYGIAVA